MISLPELVLFTEEAAAAVASERISSEDALRDVISAVEAYAHDDPSQVEQSVAQLSARFDEISSAGAIHTVPYAQLVAALAERLGLPKWIGWTHHDLGKLLKNRHPLEAEQAFRKAITAWGDDFPDFVDVAKGDLGSTLRHQGRFSEAEPLLRDALAAAQAADSLHNQLEWKLELGNLLVFAGRNDEAAGILADGLMQARATGKPYHESGFLTAAANACENAGRYDDSIAMHHRALGISEALDDLSAQSVDHENLGNLYTRLGRHADARASYERAHALAMRARDPFRQAALLGSLGASLIRSGELDEAVRVLNEAVETSARAGNLYGEERALGNLGNAYRLQNRVKEALRCHEQALHRSTRSGDPRSLAWDLLNLAELQRELGDASAACGYAERALEVAETIGDPQITRSAEWTMATLLAAADPPAPPDTVWGHFERAMHAYELPRRYVARDEDRIGLYDDGKQGVYADAVLWALGHGKVERAFETAERAKSRLLLDGIAERTHGHGTLSHPEIAAELLARIRAANAGVAYASLFLAGSETLLFTVPADAGSVSCTRLGVAEADWHTWAESWLGLVERVFGREHEPAAWSEAEAREALARLGAWVVPPLRAALGGMLPERLVFVPHRFLHAVPLHAAIDPQTGGYLAGAHAVTVLPSLQLLRPPRSAARERGPMLIVSDPQSSLPPLPRAQAEAAAIAAMFPSMLLAGETATRAAFLEHAPAASMVHLACHGHFDPVSPELSAVVLAGDERLSARDIGALWLADLELVVGAACESGLNRPGGVDEALGLSRAWMLAGAEIVLSALWTLDDAAAERFVLSFYGGLQAAGSRALSYHRAQQSLLAGDRFERDPRIWGAFVFIGIT